MPSELGEGRVGLALPPAGVVPRRLAVPDEEEPGHLRHRTREPGEYAPSVATLRLFAQARVSAGTGTDEVDGPTVGEVLDGAVARYGPAFAEVLPRPGSG